ncbi:MAG: hypothetical protein HC781_18170 [Leptolyngbyaceae cyanobacterium CSU_1_4]|nr:hypothetical protein [Leptolyngbyaceae cyanobacterium CSU_1_4]
MEDSDIRAILLEVAQQQLATQQQLQELALSVDRAVTQIDMLATQVMLLTHHVGTEKSPPPDMEFTPGWTQHPPIDL